MKRKGAKRVWTNGFIDYLGKKDITFTDKARNVLAGFALSLVLVSIYFYFFNDIFRFGSINQIFFGGKPLSVWEQFLRSCIFAPLWEELLFRYAPLEFVRRTNEKKFLLPVVVISSIIFGLSHHGVSRIFVQGVCGAVTSFVYVKNNYCYWSAFTLHFMWNAFIMFSVPLFSTP